MDSEQSESAEHFVSSFDPVKYGLRKDFRLTSFTGLKG
jgi:hypothetical protein